VHRTLDPLGRVVEEQPWHDGAADAGLVTTTISRRDPNTVEIARGHAVVRAGHLSRRGGEAARCLDQLEHGERLELERALGESVRRDRPGDRPGGFCHADQSLRWCTIRGR
jgi:hypothetical protein